jgi:hypothetical protein
MEIKLPKLDKGEIKESHRLQINAEVGEYKY